MSSYDKQYQLQRQVIFDDQPAESPTPADTTGLGLRRPAHLDTAPPNQQQLLVPGRGTFIFSYRRHPEADRLPATNLTFCTAEGRELVRLDFDAQRTRLTVDEQPTSAEAPGLSPDEYAYYWLSLDANNAVVRFGIGEARLETQLLTYPLNTDQREACRQATVVRPGPYLRPMRLLRDPIVATVPLLVRGTDRLTMDDVAANRYLPQAALPTACRQLYDTIAGPHFVLDTDDFPEFSQAIKYSIENPGGWCYKRLNTKRGVGPGLTPSKEPNRVYLRITLGHNGGESPGIPFVMEIWPPQCYSSMHQHAGANAVIRVLHGRIDVTLYPYLKPVGPPETETEPLFPYAKQTFGQDAITWVSPLLNQVHRLRNAEPLGGQPCITIQCYQYDSDDTGHYRFFDYSEDDGLHQYDPGSDMDFVAFKSLMRNEWRQRLIGSPTAAPTQS